MTATSKMGWCLFRALPFVLVPVAFIAALPWLNRISYPLTLLVAAAAVIFLMGYVNYLPYRALRRQDEVQRAGAAFAAQWGAPLGQAMFALLMVLPPFKDFALALVGKFLHPEAAVDGRVVVLSLTLGFCGVVLLQCIGTALVNTLWWTLKR
jgi:hypothetical protein